MAEVHERAGKRFHENLVSRTEAFRFEGMDQKSGLLEVFRKVRQLLINGNYVFGSMSDELIEIVENCSMPSSQIHNYTLSPTGRRAKSVVHTFRGEFKNLRPIIEYIIRWNSYSPIPDFHPVSPSSLLCSVLTPPTSYLPSFIMFFVGIGQLMNVVDMEILAYYGIGEGKLAELKQEQSRSEARHVYNFWLRFVDVNTLWCEGKEPSLVEAIDRILLSRAKTSDKTSE